MQSCRVLETAVSLQLSSFFWVEIERGPAKNFQQEKSTFFFLFLSVRYALAFPPRSLKPDIGQTFFFLHVAAFFFVFFFFSLSLFSTRPDDFVFFGGRSHTFQRTVSAYGLKCIADKRKKTTQLANFLFSHMVPASSWSKQTICIYLRCVIALVLHGWFNKMSPGELFQAIMCVFTWLGNKLSISQDRKMPPFFFLFFPRQVWN